MKRWSLGLIVSCALIHCGGGGTKTHYVGLQVELPAEIEQLPLDAVQLQAEVWQLNENGEATQRLIERQSAERTIRGNFALPVRGLDRDASYSFDIKISYRVSEMRQTQGLAAELPDPITINPNLAELCPDLALSPDQSLAEFEGEQWLELCTVSTTLRFDPKILHVISEQDLKCNEMDADGDGVGNILELAQSLNPFSGDLDGDCVPDGVDAFPTDATEARDTDGDGVGDGADLDADADGLSADLEQALGLDPLLGDTDGDGVDDSRDNCPLIRNRAQTDSDADGLGHPCDQDRDGDGLSNAEETGLGTNLYQVDTDHDGLDDRTEILLMIDPLNADSDGDGYNDAQDLFPRDNRVHADGDQDGIGDGLDLCPKLATADNQDLDRDGRANPCDGDDDGDGVSDDVELGAGLNPLDPDSDRDGLRDWFNGERDTLRDPCPLDASNPGQTVEHDTDEDGDGFGRLCDCDDQGATFHPAAPDLPDDHFLDSNCDGIDGDSRTAVFITAQGSDSNPGTQRAPLATINAGLALLKTSGLHSVYIARGQYPVAEVLTISTHAELHGGYSADFTQRESGGTVLESSLASTIFSESEGPLLFDNLELVIDGSDHDRVIGIEVEQASLTVQNSFLDISARREVVGLSVTDGQLNFSNNHLRLMDASRRSIGIEFNGAVGTLDNNLIELQRGTNRLALRCIMAGDQDILLTDNTFDLWKGFAIANVRAVYLQDCQQSASGFHYLIPFSENQEINGFVWNPSNTLDGLF